MQPPAAYSVLSRESWAWGQERLVRSSTSSPPPTQRIRYLGSIAPSQDPDVLEPDVDSFLLLQHHVHHPGMGEIHHTISREEPLPCPEGGRAAEDLGDTLEGMDMVRWISWACSLRAARGPMVWHSRTPVMGFAARTLSHGPPGTQGRRDGRSPDRRAGYSTAPRGLRGTER